MTPSVSAWFEVYEEKLCAAGSLFMTKELILFLSITFVFPLFSHAGQCTKEEISDLKRSGFAQSEINQLCSKFHPDNYSILNATKGNLNRDNIDDIVLVPKQK